MMSLDYSVCELKEGDLEKDLSGFLMSLQNISPIGSIPLNKSKQILSKINSQEGHIFIAKTSEGNIIGSTTLSVEQKFIHKCGKVGHIEDVSVRKSYEGFGVGSALVREAIEVAGCLGCYKVILNCNDDNVPFYKKLGFSLNENEMRFNF